MLATIKDSLLKKALLILALLLAAPFALVAQSIKAPQAPTVRVTTSNATHKSTAVAGTIGSGTHSITMTWTQSVSSGVTGNNVYYSTTNGGPYSLLYSSAVPIVTYEVFDVTSGVYYFVVTALDETIESNYSNQAAITVVDVNPPTGLTAVQTK